MLFELFLLRKIQAEFQPKRDSKTQPCDRWWDALTIELYIKTQVAQSRLYGSM